MARAEGKRVTYDQVREDWKGLLWRGSLEDHHHVEGKIQLKIKQIPVRNDKHEQGREKEMKKENSRRKKE